MALAKQASKKPSYSKPQARLTKMYSCVRRTSKTRLSVLKSPTKAMRGKGSVTVTLKHPTRPVGQAWPLSALRAFDIPGDIGWGDLLRQVLQTRGWKVRPPCHSADSCVFIREFEATLRRQTPAKLFGQKGAVEEGHRLQTLPLPPRALWMQSISEYRVPGPRTRCVLREDFSRLVARHGSALPGKPGDYRILGFPGMDTALAKTNFAEHFREAPWYPKSYVLPAERAELLARLSTHPREHWITKPRNECSGAGICVFAAADPALAEQVQATAGRQRSVAQKYVADPMLLGGYKFHLRIHLLVTSLSPPQAFVQAGGQCLCSTKPYTNARSTLGNSFDAPVHISNTGLNMLPEQQEGFLRDKPVIGKGQQITVRQMEAHLSQEHPRFDRDDFWSQILRISTETVQYLARAPAIRQHGKLEPEQFFDILGMDLILDKNAKVWMCETNGSPSLSDQDRQVFGVTNPDFRKENEALSQVWHDTLALLGVDAKRQQPRGTLRGWYELDFSSDKP